MVFWTRHVSAEPTSAQVAIDKGEWTDSARQGRIVPYKIYRPMDLSGGPFPVVIWSHGLGGSRDGAGFLSRYIASYGYVIVHIQHAGTDSGLWEGKPGHPWDVIRAARIPRKATLQRFRDVPFALCELEKMALANPDLGAAMDFTRLGMSGHSFGAMTTQIMAGQRRGRGARLYSLHEPKFRAGILYSPVPQRNKKGESAETLYGEIKIPLLAMTGTADDSPLENSGYEDRLEVFEHSGGPDQHLLVLEDGDHMVYSGSRGQLGKNPKRDIHEEIICILSLAFWEAYLKEDSSAKDWLAGDGVQGFLREEARYTYRA